jgi:hypothetical protein
VQTLPQSMAFFEGLVSWQAGLRWTSIEMLWLGVAVAFGHVAGVLLRSGRVNETLLRVFDIKVIHDDLIGWYAQLGTRTVLGVWLIVTWVLLALLFAPTKVSPFIYFQF